jgi:hypothetical protein
MRLRADHGGDLPSHTRRPAQQGIAHGAGDLIDAGVRRRDIDQPALAAIKCQPLCLHPQRQPGDGQPPEGRCLHRRRERRPAGRSRLRHVAADAVDIPPAVGLAEDAPGVLRLLDGGVGDTEATSNLAR